MNKAAQVAPGRAANAIHWQRFSVPFEYPVVFARDVFAAGSTVLAEAVARAEPDGLHRCLVFIDSGVTERRPDFEVRVEDWFKRQSRLALAAQPRIVPGGEAVKRDPEHVEAVQEAIRSHGVDRHSYVLAIGGGAVLDAVGLGAAIAHRGVRHVRLPSTVLSQNDSGVGVKNAVNFKGSKNFTGSFAPPWAVVNDLDFLDYLPPRERLAGISEAVKVALIRDAEFFEWLALNADRLARFQPEAEEWMIRRCAELHMHQIAHGGDPFEQGSARPLDFGHWAAHKLESLTEHTVSHGEAVAIGVALDARYSVLAGLLPEGAETRVADLLRRLGFRLSHPALLAPAADGRPEVLAGLDEFRQHLGGKLTVTMLRGLGEGVEVHEIDADLMIQALRWLERLDARDQKAC